MGRGGRAPAEGGREDVGLGNVVGVGSVKPDELYRIPFVSDARLSPDGRRVAFVVTQADRDADEDRSRIWMVDADGEAAPRVLTTGPADSQPRWSPDGRWLAFVGRRAGHDRSQLWVLPTDGGGEPRRITAVDGGVGGPVWSPDGSRLAFTSACPTEATPTEGKPTQRTATQGTPTDRHAPYVVRQLGWKADGRGWLRRRPQVFVVDVEGGEPRQLTSGPGSAGSPAWSPDGRRLAAAGSFEPDPDLEPASHIYLVDADDSHEPGAPVRLTHHRGQASAPVFTPDGSTVVFAGTAGPEVGHERLFRVPVGGGVPEAITAGFDRNVMVGAPAYPGASPIITPDGRQVLFCARDQGLTHVYAVPLSGGEPVKLVGTPETSVSGLSLGSDGRRAAMVESGPDGPGEVGVFAVDDGSVDRRTRLATDVLGNRHRFEPRSFRAPDGVEAHGWVMRARSGAGAGPLLLDVHGGPHNAWSPVFDGVHLYHHMLAEAGWNVLIINPRGSDGYGEAFHNGLVEKGWGQDDVQDFMSAVDALVDAGEADPDRLAVAGYSYGGFMTATLTARTDRFRVAVAGGVVVDLVGWTGSFDIGEVWAAAELGTAVAGGIDRLLAQSPISIVDRVRTPTLVLHGAEDHRCPVTQAEQWFSALRSQGVETEMVLYPGEGHLFILQGRPSHRVDYNQRIFDWLTSHVNG